VHAASVHTWLSHHKVGISRKEDLDGSGEMDRTYCDYPELDPCNNQVDKYLLGSNKLSSQIPLSRVGELGRNPQFICINNKTISGFVNGKCWRCANYFVLIFTEGVNRER
jgi:hypothetical protein